MRKCLTAVREFAILLGLRQTCLITEINMLDRLTDMVDTMIEDGEIVLNDRPEFEGEDE